MLSFPRSVLSVNCLLLSFLSPFFSLAPIVSSFSHHHHPYIVIDRLGAFFLSFSSNVCHPIVYIIGARLVSPLTYRFTSSPIIKMASSPLPRHCFQSPHLSIHLSTSFCPLYQHHLGGKEFNSILKTLSHPSLTNSIVLSTFDDAAIICRSAVDLEVRTSTDTNTNTIPHICTGKYANS